MEENHDNELSQAYETQVHDEIKINTVVVKRGRGRPKSVKEIGEKPPRIKREPPPPRDKMTAGRKVGSKTSLWRYREDGTYNTAPLNANEYYRNYYKIYGHTSHVCEHCGSTIHGKSNLGKHRKSIYCRDIRALKTITDVVITDCDNKELIFIDH